jgi:hypothetical protein
MSSHNKAQKADSGQGLDHAVVSEYAALREVSHNMTYYAEAGQDQDINLRVAKKSK